MVMPSMFDMSCPAIGSAGGGVGAGCGAAGWVGRGVAARLGAAGAGAVGAAAGAAGAISCGTGGAAAATKYVLWAKLETVTNNWAVCSDGRSGKTATWPVDSTCPPFVQTGPVPGLE